jgi:superfamily II DNA or RNA helicase
MEEGAWVYSTDHGQLCRVIERETLWGETTCRVWLPSQDAVVRVRAEQLKRPDESLVQEPEAVSYVAAAARVADALTQDILLAPIEASVIPLPHQIHALGRAIEHDRVRYLLADEVGLGKTIEAGLIMRELKLRGLVRRTLVIAPKGLVTQWVAEMQTHFGEEFRLLIPSDFSAYRRIARQDNIWHAYDQVVTPLDSVKPSEGRRGSSRQKMDEYNRERFEDLVAAGWDLVIVDEAHRLGGSTDQVARYKLGQGVSEAAPYLLLLSGTPHQGKTEAFHRLISLLDEDAFPDVGTVTRERVQPFVIRNEKRRAIDAGGAPLFKPRRTQLVPVTWQPHHAQQQRLYEAVTDYVCDGYNQAIREKRTHVGFLMILMQRLVASSTSAIRTTLERRLEALQGPEEQLSLFPLMSDDEWADLDGQEQVDMLLGTRLKALKNERAEVKLLLEAAQACEHAGPDAKAEALLEWIYRLQQEEGAPDLKVLVFTEFVPTQAMLRGFLTDRGFSVACLNGSMGMDERRRAQEEFAEKARILVSTDAGGEGLNLQFCHAIINYDIPWNPMRIEQRIGRVDRIGQTHAVRAVNLLFEDTVEFRIREVLEEKLAVILREFGVDKASDVLDSAQGGQMFEHLYVEAILHPEEVVEKVDSVIQRIREQAEAAKQSVLSVLGPSNDLSPGEAQRLMTHPLPHWVERMTVSYLQSNGGAAARHGVAWDLVWPNAQTDSNVVFTIKDLEETPTAQHLTLDDSRVRGLAMRLARFAPGQPILRLALPDLPADLSGYWSLWQIRIHGDERNRCRIIPLFLHDDGRCLTPAARHVWDQLLTVSPIIRGHVMGEPAERAFAKTRESAEIQGRPIYDELLRAHDDRLSRERDKGGYAFAARRRAIERIGLPAVRAHRFAQIEEEERHWRDRLQSETRVTPEMTPLIIVRLEGGRPRA